MIIYFDEREKTFDIGKVEFFQEVDNVSFNGYPRELRLIGRELEETGFPVVPRMVWC